MSGRKVAGYQTAMQGLVQTIIHTSKMTNLTVIPRTEFTTVSRKRNVEPKSEEAVIIVVKIGRKVVKVVPSMID
jgi:hypothetical protein